MTYSPIYKRPQPTKLYRVINGICTELKTEGARDAGKVVLGLLICFAGGFYGMPYLAACI